MVRCICFLIALAFAPALLAQAVPPQPGDPLQCSVADRSVKLSWQIAFLVPIKGWLIARDGAKLALLDPGASSYLDAAVPAGDHVYTLSAISLDGTVSEMGRCAVTVGRPGGLSCAVDGRNVHLEWGPMLITVVIQKFVVSRDGLVVASLPPTQLSYDDQAPTAGDFHYQVAAVAGANAEFVVGSCDVTVDCFGLSSSVEGLKVSLKWPPGLGGPARPIPINPVYLISRDGQFVARTPELQYTETVPGPGTYLYEVYFDAGTGGIPVFLIAACRVKVPGEGLPAPQDLVCAVVEGPQPLPGDPNTGVVGPDGSLIIPVVFVLLKWTNPVAYDKIAITRNGMLVASLAGDVTQFRDQVAGGGVLVYGVAGLRQNERSAAAECKVEAPPDRVPPPQGFTCFMNDLVLGPNDPDAAGNVPPGGVPVPFLAVVLRWWNPLPYRGLVILRDGEAIAKLPGDAMVYRDVAPAAGKHVYGIFGVAVDGRQSQTAECEIFVGGTLPPVESLICGAEEKANPDTVDLSWKNGAFYEMILISRNGEGIARLPGDSTAYKDAGLAPGVYIYEVVGVADNGQRRSPPVSCQAVVDGPPSRDALYFSTSFVRASPAGNVPPDRSIPGSRITCLATTSREVQGWSFGVQTDPKFVVPLKYDLDGTATAALNGGAGPSFLNAKILAGGVVMAVVIDDSAPFETLPPANGHAFLNIDYGAGPSGAQGEIYPVRYSSALGDPPVQVLFVVNGFEARPATFPGGVTIPGVRFLRADSNGDGKVDISDPSSTLNWLFLGGDRPGCLEAADANQTGDVNIADAIYLFSYLFGGGAPPPWPFPACGEARAPLGCDKPGNCL